MWLPWKRLNLCCCAVRPCVEVLMRTNKWRRNTLTKPNRNTLINYATGSEALSIQVTHSCSLSIHAAEGGICCACRIIPVYLSFKCFSQEMRQDQDQFYFCQSVGKCVITPTVCHKIHTLCITAVLNI